MCSLDDQGERAWKRENDVWEMRVLRRDEIETQENVRLEGGKKASELVRVDRWEQLSLTGVLVRLEGTRYEW
jgi:hypothetical protein